MTVDGWVPVNPLTLETAFADVYAVGDVTSVGTPKAGVFAEGQASVVASQIASRSRGGDETETYDGRGVCYLEFGDDLVARVDVTFLSGTAPVGDLEGPSRGDRRRQAPVREQPHPELVRPRLDALTPPTAVLNLRGMACPHAQSGGGALSSPIPKVVIMASSR